MTKMSQYQLYLLFGSYVTAGRNTVQLLVSTDTNKLRQKVADHLALLYRDFLCQPVSSDDGYNTDTEQPTAGWVKTISDPRMQTELRWEEIPE